MKTWMALQNPFSRLTPLSRIASSRCSTPDGQHRWSFAVRGTVAPTVASHRPARRVTDKQRM
jgi:hypothetical protein